MRNIMSKLSIVILLIYLTLKLKFVKSDCMVSEWENWKVCSKNCSVGLQQRKRSVTQKPHDIFSKACPNLEETRPCGVINNGCQDFCDEKTGDCHCKLGFQLSNSLKSCTDINECSLNNGLGVCSQICKNVVGSFKCSCLDGFLLSENTHDCHYYASAENCTHYQQRSSTGKCVCQSSLVGPKCDRNVSLCQKDTCKMQEICSNIEFLSKRCYETSLQIPVLLHIPFKAYNEQSFQYKVEVSMESMLEGNTKSLDFNSMQAKSRSKRSTNIVYVQGFFPMKVKNAYTYITYIALDANHNFSPIKTSEACKTLQYTNARCISLSDCNILRSVGIPCPAIYKPVVRSEIISSNKNVSPLKPWFFVLITGIIIMIIISSVLLIFYYKRKQKHQKLLNQGTDEYEVRNSQPLLLIERNNSPTFHTRPKTLPGFGIADTCLSSPSFDKRVFSETELDDKLKEENPLYQSIECLTTNLGEYYVSMDKNNYDVPKMLPDEGEQVELTVEYSNEPRYVSPPSQNKIKIDVEHDSTYMNHK